MPEITAHSIPEYDVPFYPFDNAWSCQDWMTWHKLMIEEFGKDEADRRFIEAWNDQNYFEWNVSFCKYNQEFRSYFINAGLDPDNFVSQITGNVIETGKNLSESAKDLSGSLANNAFLKVVLILVFIGGLYRFIFVQN